MASGDIGTVIESRLYSTPSGAYPFESYRAIDPNQFQHISGDVYAFFSKQSPFVTTFSCTAAGDLSNSYIAQLDLTAQTVRNYSTGYFHIAGNVYGCVYSTTASGSRYMRVVTFSISDDGSTIAIIADTIISSEGYANTCYYGINVDYLGSNQYVFTGQATSGGGGVTATLRFKFFTVSDDGVSIAEVATSDYSALAGTSWGGIFKKITDEYYCFAYVYASGYYIALTFRVQAGGTVTFIDNLTLGYMGQPTATLNINICKISPYVWAAAMNEYTGGAKKRLITFECDEEGNLGSILDTDDTVIFGNGARMLQLEYYSGPEFVLITHYDGSGGRIHTISVGLDGTIGAVIGDRVPSAYPVYTYYTGTADSYVCFTLESAFYARSLTVILPDPEVETLGNSETKWNRATLWGNVTEADMAEYYGFEWSETGGTFENDEIFSDPQKGVFSADITGLSAFTFYKFRAFIEVGGTRFYGAVLEFNTPYPIPEVHVELPSNVGDDFVDAVGLIWDSGATVIDEYGFVYGYSQLDDNVASIGWDDPPEDVGYDFVKTIEGALGGSELSDNAASGQNKVNVDYILGFVGGVDLSDDAASSQKIISVDDVTGYSVGMNVRIQDDLTQEDNVIASINEEDNEITMLNDLANEYTMVNNARIGQIVRIQDNATEEDNVVASITGDEITMETNLSNTYTTAEDARICTTFTIKLDSLQYARRYYIRPYAHNSYGYNYGSEIVALTSDTVNLMYPAGTASKGIRFCIPGKLNFPPSGMYYNTRHHLCVRSADSYFTDEGAFGWVVGKYVAERQYWGQATNVDLYTMSNPTRREEAIVKVKYKARVGNNGYGLGSYHKRVIYNGASSLTGDYIGCSTALPWHCEVFNDNPWTSAPWTLAQVDALQMGISIRSGTGFETPLCDCIEGRVCWANADVKTYAAIPLTDTSVRLKGQVLEDEAEDCEVYFEYGETTGYGSETTPEAAIKGQFFYAEIDGLDAMTSYHCRAVIVTDCGETFYGNDVPFDMAYPDRIYAWLGDSAEDELVELTDPDYPMVLSLRTERGWDEVLAQASAGIAELTCDNFFGDFNPENAGGHYYEDLVLGKWLTIYEVYQGTKYRHFTGKIEKILPNDNHEDPTAYIMAVDGMDDISATKISTVLRQDTDVGELAEDALDACNWDAGKRDIDSGIDTLEYGWFNKIPGLDALRDLELTENGRFFIKRNGDARFENRHYRISGDGLVSQATFDDTAIRIQYEWSKRLLYNDVQVTGRRYFAGSIQLFSGYDMATLDTSLIWSSHTGDAAAPYIPQSSTVTLWAEFGSPLSSYDALVKGTHWNANTSPDKSGDDVSDNITINVTQLGQALKLEIVNAGTMGAYIVEPNSPPDAETEGKTLLVYGILFGSENVTVIEEDTDSQDNYGKRTLEVDAPFKSKPNDILAYAQWLLARYYMPIPNPVEVAHVARTGWPDDTLRIQCLIREISDRITVASTKLGFDRDFYINKVIQEYAMNEGGMVHDTIWFIEQAEGSAEGLYWLLGVAGFGELGEMTKLGF